MEIFHKCFYENYKKRRLVNAVNNLQNLIEDNARKNKQFNQYKQKHDTVLPNPPYPSSDTIISMSNPSNTKIDEENSIKNTCDHCGQEIKGGGNWDFLTNPKTDRWYTDNDVFSRIIEDTKLLKKLNKNKSILSSTEKIYTNDELKQAISTELKLLEKIILENRRKNVTFDSELLCNFTKISQFPKNMQTFTVFPSYPEHTNQLLPKVGETKSNDEQNQIPTNTNVSEPQSNLLNNENEDLPSNTFTYKQQSNIESNQLKLDRNSIDDPPKDNVISKTEISNVSKKSIGIQVDSKVIKQILARNENEGSTTDEYFSTLGDDDDRPSTTSIMNVIKSLKNDKKKIAIIAYNNDFAITAPSSSSSSSGSIAAPPPPPAAAAAPTLPSTSSLKSQSITNYLIELIDRQNCSYLCEFSLPTDQFQELIDNGLLKNILIIFLMDCVPFKVIHDENDRTNDSDNAVQTIIFNNIEKLPRNYDNKIINQLMKMAIEHKIKIHLRQMDEPHQNTHKHILDFIADNSEYIGSIMLSHHCLFQMLKHTDKKLNLIMDSKIVPPENEYIFSKIELLNLLKSATKV